MFCSIIFGRSNYRLSFCSMEDTISHYQQISDAKQDVGKHIDKAQVTTFLMFAF